MRAAWLRATRAGVGWKSNHKNNRSASLGKTEKSHHHHLNYCMLISQLLKGPGEKTESRDCSLMNLKNYL